MVEEQEKQGFSEEQVQFMKSIVLKEVQLYRQEVMDQLENLQIHILKSANFEMSRAEGAEHGKNEVSTKLSDSQTNEQEKSLKQSNGPIGSEESIPEGKDVSSPDSPKNRAIKHKHTKFCDDVGDNPVDHSISHHHHRPGNTSPNNNNNRRQGNSPRQQISQNRWDKSPIKSRNTSPSRDREVLGVNESSVREASPILLKSSGRRSRDDIDLRCSGNGTKGGGTTHSRLPSSTVTSSKKEKRYSSAKEQTFL